MRPEPPDPWRAFLSDLDRAVPLDVTVLRQRYQEELRPYLGNPAREDLTLDLWVEAIEERRGIPGRAKDR
jgi:hypothetical protein